MGANEGGGSGARGAQAAASSTTAAHIRIRLEALIDSLRRESSKGNWGLTPFSARPHFLLASGGVSA
jgi:hypothetical protein